MLKLIQYLDDENNVQSGISNSGNIKRIGQNRSVYSLACQAIEEKKELETLINEQKLTDETYSLGVLLNQKKILPPITHPDNSHCYVTGTGLTHMGSAETRSEMHSTQESSDETDSMKMFRMGIKGGKPCEGEVGAQPEWFYKGSGYIVVPPEQDFSIPSFSLDASEEPEIVGCYINDNNGNTYRVGFALGNELSDHITERENYLFLAHSKLRPCSFGPELLIGDLPRNITGRSKIIRDGNVIWEKEFLSGEDNMSHSINNLEYHHFKYDLFKQPNDLHLHFFGTATLSFGDVNTQDGDVFEIESPTFGFPLKNTLRYKKDVTNKKVNKL